MPRFTKEKSSPPAWPTALVHLVCRGLHRSAFCFGKPGKYKNAQQQRIFSLLRHLSFPIARTIYGGPVETAAPYPLHYIGCCFQKGTLLIISVFCVFRKPPPRQRLRYFPASICRYSQIFHDLLLGGRCTPENRCRTHPPKTPRPMRPPRGTASPSPCSFSYCGAAACLQALHTPENTISCVTSVNPVCRATARSSRAAPGSVTS